MKHTLTSMAFISLLALTACGTKEYKPKDYILELDYKSDFRILQLTDIHLSDKDDKEAQYKFMNKIYDAATKEKKIDLMVVTGDLFTFAGKSTAKSLLNYLDSKNVPWTVCFGNHDEQCYFSVDWLTETLSKYGSNCLFKDLQDDKVNGNCNFVINLKEGDKVHDQLFIMDSNRYNYGFGQMGYDCFKQDQIDWYESIVLDAKKNNGDVTVNSLMFYHIPLPEINDVWKAAEEGRAIKVWGEKREASCPPDHDYGFYKKIKELGSTTGMFFGHDHINDFEIDYEGIKFCYGLKSTDRIYHDDDMLGGKVITIHDDHSLKVDNILVEY